MEQVTQAPDDHTNTPITVNFASGETRKIIAIPLVNDTLIEKTETINLGLSNPTGGTAVGSQSTAVLNIFDDDVQIAFTSTPFGVNEDGTSLSALTLTRTGRLTGTVGATLVLSDGTATAPQDYTKTSTAVNFASGEGSKTILLAIVNDLAVEGNEIINLSPIDPTGGATLGTQNTASFILVDNDAAPTGLVLIGDGKNNILIGKDGNDTLHGGNGNDTLDGGAGVNQLFGGLGNDTYFADSLDDRITEDINAGTDTVQSSISWTLGSNLENLVLTGNNPIDGTGNPLNNTLIGNSAPNFLFGGDSNDRLDGGAGNDSLVGNIGNDTYTVDSIGDTIAENANEGTDSVNSSISLTLEGTNLENLTLLGTNNINGTGNAFDNAINGNTGNNTLIGLDGNDNLDGKAGNDTLEGGKGNDTYTIDSVGDVITENANEGTDSVRSSLTSSLDGTNLENLTLTGTANLNGTGNNADNTLTGNNGNNTLAGGGGDDRLNGSLGSDTLLGGVGHDTLAVSVAEFGGGLTVGSFLDANQFRVGAGATTADHRFIYNSTNGALFFDPDGTNAIAPTQIATLSIKLAMSHLDILAIV